ncbi:MAG: ABC transporter permease [Bacteriovoracaceae bacterium]|nr:ABC transporter permease [Bacteriovoracaceae bacterium]
MTLSILWASILILFCAALSLVKQHKIEKSLLLSSLRAIVQVSVLGFLLKYIFQSDSPFLIASIAFIMTVNAAIQSKSRITERHPQLILNNFYSIALSIWPMALLASYLFGADPIWKTEILLPLLGMLLGNTLTGISLGIDSFGKAIKQHKEDILTLLALGANEKEATSSYINDSIHTAMTPTLNALVSMGIVSIPGMMTGQILAGKDTTEAASLQIVIMLLIAAAAYLATLMAINLSLSQVMKRNEIIC